MCGGNFKHFSFPLASFHQNIEPKEIDKNFYDLIVIGAGPAGLNSALQAKKRGLNYILLESRKLAQGLILNPSGSFYPGYKGYFAPLKGDLWFQSAPKDLLLRRWWSQAKDLSLHENEPVIDIHQDHDGLWVISNQKKYQTKYIILATGFNRFPFSVDFPNVFIAGQARGARSIVHSANQGFEMVEHIALKWGKQKIEESKESSLEKEKSAFISNQTNIQPKDFDPQLYDIAVIGAGPAGIEAALQAKEAGLKYLLFDKESAGATIENSIKNKKFHHIYGGNKEKLKGDLIYSDNTAGHELVGLWNKEVKNLNFIPDTEVVGIQSGNPSLSLLTKNIAYKTKNIILATGIFENQRKLNIDGEKDNPFVLYQIDDPEEYQNKKILIIGGENSAAETAINLADNNRVILVIRKDNFAHSLTKANKELIENLERNKKIEIWFESEIKKIKNHRAYIIRKRKPNWEKFDFMIVQIGFEMPLDFLKRVGIEIKGFQPIVDKNLQTSVPGIYIAGSLTGANSIIQSANQGYDVVQYIISQQDNHSALTVKELSDKLLHVL